MPPTIPDFEPNADDQPDRQVVDSSGCRPERGDPAELADDERAAVQRSQRQPVEEARLDVARKIGSGVHVAKSAPWMNGNARKKARNESVGKPGMLGRRAQAGGGDREQRGREDEREDDVRRLARGAQDRAARDLADLAERVT